MAKKAPEHYWTDYSLAECTAATPCTGCLTRQRDALVEALAYWVEHVETSTMPETVALKGWLGKARAALDAAKGA